MKEKLEIIRTVLQKNGLNPTDVYIFHYLIDNVYEAKIDGEFYKIVELEKNISIEQAKNLISSYATNFKKIIQEPEYEINDVLNLLVYKDTKLKNFYQINYKAYYCQNMYKDTLVYFEEVETFKNKTSIEEKLEEVEKIYQTISDNTDAYFQIKDEYHEKIAEAVTTNEPFKSVIIYGGQFDKYWLNLGDANLFIHRSLDISNVKESHFYQMDFQLVENILKMNKHQTFPQGFITDNCTKLIIEIKDILKEIYKYNLVY